MIDHATPAERLSKLERGTFWYEDNFRNLWGCTLKYRDLQPTGQLWKPSTKRPVTWWIPLALALAIWAGWIAVAHLVSYQEAYAAAQERARWHCVKTAPGTWYCVEPEGQT